VLDCATLPAVNWNKSSFCSGIFRLKRLSNTPAATLGRGKAREPAAELQSNGAGEIVERILAEVSDFANDEPQRDDVTLVVMKVQEGCDMRS
jgi:hypothetical protein